MKPILSSVLMLALSVFSTMPLAAQEANPITVKGAGSAPCSEALRVYGASGSQTDRGLYLQWVTGLSVGAAMANQVADVSPSGEITDLVQIALLICQEPQFSEGLWHSATVAAISRLRPYYAKKPDRVTITYQNNSYWFYADAVSQLQSDLRKLGHEIAVDGKYGEKTGAAVAAVQERIGIRGNPVPTATLFYGLTRPAN